MARHGPSKRRVGWTVGGWVGAKPSDRRAEIEAAVGCELPDTAWKRIDLAFRHIRVAEHAEKLPVLNKDKNDPMSVRRYRGRRLREIAAKLKRQAEIGITPLSDSSKITRELKRLASMESTESPYPPVAEAKALAVAEVATAVRDVIEIDAPKNIRKAGLTPFQVLVRELEIHQFQSEAAFAKWLHGALGRKIP